MIKLQAAFTSAQLYDYSTLQSSVNVVSAQAEKQLQSYRRTVSELVLSTTDEMITYATNSLTEGGDDPKAPMIGACTLYPTNYLNHYTKELTGKLSKAQTEVNSMKFALLKALMNQPMISEAEATYNKVQAEVQSLSGTWQATVSLLDTELATYKEQIKQLVLDMQECIAITDA